MTATAVPARPAEPLKLATHVVVGIAIGLVAPFTALAWPFALLTGIVIGKGDAGRLRGEAGSSASGIVRVLAVTGGVLGMLFFGALIGGLIAFVVVALAAFSERAAAFATPNDRSVARLLLVIVPVLTWILLAVVLRIGVQVRIGG